MAKDWAGDPRNASTEGDFTRDVTYIADRIVASVPAGSAPTPMPGTSGGVGRMLWPVEAGRYRLMAARACPWANRAVIIRRLMGLEDAFSLSLAGPTHDVRSWNYDGVYPGDVDPVLGIPRLQDAYFARVSDYPRGITVPAMAEVATGQVVTNDYDQMTIDFIREWSKFQRPGAPDLYPDGLVDQIEELNELIYPKINNGVYRCGFASSQDAYERAYRELWDALDQVTERLARQRYLVGDHITLADIRLFTTLVRFDPVYHGHFKANRSKLSEIPVLWGYLRDLFQTPGFGDTIDFPDIKAHYYVVHKEVNPTQVVPVGPDLSGLLTSHGREELGGSPFGDGTPPDPVRHDERPPAGSNPLYT
ncbi:MAG TPA: glutathione S-transferase C-terminal domain-containing protein [Mycobacterium sp.]|jgi:putative glutathione S-transferase|uniref:glutathione S-transferase C-terminal domain-containing protein n=1 Tax=Brooklawnia sp. TaxID=2699740 RepID=UPI002C492B21|nr:glutathione S-transferase C-terminal domain-containing protein [Mycobacterium sp.]HQA78843.1 glutathione S-transferase C-terminal domain-containing protein [Propionicimonas sp.]